MAIMFPGTLMEVFEKYPDSRRLDHPNFGDVSKTTFAKGVITDFNKIADDPFEVESMVKVDVGGEAWLPLFYHPKVEYWDGEEVLAQDFDEEKGCFKRAWQSFRCGDEVAVMLQAGIPVAVVGFADGKPRIGEDIVKVIAPHSDGTQRFFHLQMSKINADGIYGELDIEKKGPDGLELGLTEEHLPGEENYYQRPASEYYPDSSGDARNYGWLEQYTQPSPGGTLLNREITDIRQEYVEFIFVIGPILHIIQVLATRSLILYHSYDLGYGNDPPYHYEPTNGVPLDQGVRVVTAGDCAFSPVFPDDVKPGTIPNLWTIIDIQCRAAIYNEELLATIQGAGPVSAESAYNDFALHGSNYEWGTKYPGTIWQSESKILNLLASMFSFTTWPKWDATNFKVRPHNG